MTKTSTQALELDFARVVKRAWSSSTVVYDKAASEPNHVARFIHGAPAGLAASIKRVRGVAAVAVQGTFCHQSPYAFWKTRGSYPRRELADLLILVDLVVGGVKRSRALLVQAKMGKAGAPTWQVGETVGGLDQGQRSLYAELPPFCLEFAGRPRRESVQASGKSLGQYMKINASFRPYELEMLKVERPVGLVFVAIDRNLARPAVAVVHPWLAEDARPASSGKVAKFDVPFSRALAEMVSLEDTRFGLRTEPALAPEPDWTRLIGELQTWARRRYTGVQKSHHGVTLNAGASTDHVFHNIRGFAIEGGTLRSLMRWEHLCDKDRSAPWPVAMVPKRDYHVSWIWNALHAHPDGDGKGEPPWPDSIEREDPGGFGMLKIRIELRP